ncbi:TPA: hypothetical protein ACGO1T_001222 [Streptococcus suis]
MTVDGDSIWKDSIEFGLDAPLPTNTPMEQVRFLYMLVLVSNNSLTLFFLLNIKKSVISSIILSGQTKQKEGNHMTDYNNDQIFLWMKDGAGSKIFH